MLVRNLGAANAGVPIVYTGTTKADTCTLHYVNWRFLTASHTRLLVWGAAVRVPDFKTVRVSERDMICKITESQLLHDRKVYNEALNPV